MTNEQFRTEIKSAKLADGIKNPSLSDEHFATYWILLKYPDCDVQLMFHVKPLNEDGEEIPEDFYFLSEKAALKFMDTNRDYHTLAWWQAMKSARYQKYFCLASLYMVRNAMKGGVK